jgi:hypothetical protein
MKTFLKPALALAMFATPAGAVAGPCAKDIAKLQTAFDQRLNAAAAQGPSGVETTDAKLHHQPTQQSVAEAEANLGDITPETADKFTKAMERASDADAANDATKCRVALNDARAVLKN